MTTAKSVVFVSLGSNIEPQWNLRQAVDRLGQSCLLRAESHAYRTPPQGYLEQDAFLNMAVCLETDLQPLLLKVDVLASIERELGRVRDPNNKNAPRTIDLDISLWDNRVFEYGEKPWRVPDPDILRFAHVVVPLAELAPDFLHPETGETLRAIANRLDAGGFERLHV